MIKKVESYVASDGTHFDTLEQAQEWEERMTNQHLAEGYLEWRDSPESVQKGEQWTSKRARTAAGALIVDFLFWWQNESENKNTAPNPTAEEAA